MSGEEREEVGVVELVSDYVGRQNELYLQRSKISGHAAKPDGGKDENDPSNKAEESKANALSTVKEEETALEE